MESCQVTRTVIAAYAAGTLRDDPQLSAHLQVCTHCLAAVFGLYRDGAPPSAPRERVRVEADTIEP